MTLYILKYNNYYNRMYKRELTVEEYVNASNAVNFTPYILKANFSPNDNVNTEHTIGTGDYDGTGDYFLAVDVNGQIVSRWFIVEAIRTRGGQYKLYLHRDVVADFYDNFRSKPAFIEKGIANDDSVLIYNKENFTTNQIKTSEKLLKDETNCPWLVGYLARRSESGITSLSGQLAPSINPDYKVTELSELPFYTDIGRDLYGYTEDSSITLTYGFSGLFGSTEVKTYNYNHSRQLSTQWLQQIASDYFALASNSTHYPTNDVVKRILNDNYSTIFAASIPALLSIESKEKTKDIQNYSGRLVQQGDKFYRVVVEESNYSISNRYPESEFPVAYTIARTILTEDGLSSPQKFVNGDPVRVSANGTKYVISLTEVEVDVNQIYHWELPVDRVHLQDAPYDMFCMPYGSIDVGSVTTNKELNMTIMNDILSESVVGAGGIIYDAQILPYCPLPTDIVTGTSIDLSQFPSTNYYSSIVKGEGETAETVGYIFFLTSSSFNVTINESITISNKKIQSETDLHRLCSPNYNGMFDFNAAMNNGVDYFIAECTYLPFTPYIHVKPNFKNLYGTFDFPDARGLICNGDFSLPVANSAWNQYKLQNKNYNEIFLRQIQNLTTQHKYQGWQDIASAITGTIGGALSGAAMGSMIAPGVGTAIGGLGGAGISALGGITDIFVNKELRAEALDYTQDLHDAQLGNIQAVPDSLTRVSAFTINNRLYPVLEYYTCSDEEKRALANKIAYNGMQINVIDTFENYAGRTWSYSDSTTTIEAKNYVKCKLIRCEDLFEDTHLLNSLSEELNRGVYLQ